jgi:hypothetical protein
MAHREFEAWFLATIESPRGRSGIREDAEPHPSPEEPRGAKEQLEARMTREVSYMERVDQPKLAATFDMRIAYARCRSFRKMVMAFGDLAGAAGASLSAWPPPKWAQVSE